MAPKFIQMPLVNSVWLRIISVSVIFLIIALSDAILAFWTPAFIQEKVGSAFLMGIIMSFSSMVGLATDFLLPQLIRGSNIRKLMLMSFGVSLVYGVIMLTSITLPVIVVFLAGMAAWGIYYEILGFARQQFVADATPHKMHASAMAMIMIFWSLAYTVGPLIAEVLALQGDTFVVVGAIILTLIGIITSRFLIPKSHSRVRIHMANINMWSEFRHWRTLFHIVWPMILISIMMGMIDAAFWTTGPVLSGKISETNVLGSFIVPAHVFPSLFMGFIIMRLHIYKRKKKLAEIFFFISGILLALVGLTDSVAMMLVCIFASSIFLSLAYPLVEAVYTDISERMGVRQEAHLIGLSNSAWSIAYIIGPIVAGFISSTMGEKDTFVIFGAASAVLALVLFFVTKRKLALPQVEIQKWK